MRCADSRVAQRLDGRCAQTEPLNPESAEAETSSKIDNYSYQLLVQAAIQQTSSKVPRELSGGSPGAHCALGPSAGVGDLPQS